MAALYTALRNLTVRIDKNSPGIQQTDQKFIAIKQQMEGTGKVAQVEFGDSINSVVRRFDARSDGQAKDRATSLNEGIKSEGKSKIPPCLSFGPDDPNLGVGAKTEKPPWAKSGHKMDMGTDSISTEKEKPTQQLKTEQTPTQKLKTEQIPEPWETNERIGGEVWDSIGATQTDGGQYRPMLPPKGNYEKGGNPSPMWSNLRADHGCNAFFR